jgi:hypothetical protein
MNPGKAPHVRQQTLEAAPDFHSQLRRRLLNRLCKDSGVDATRTHRVTMASSKSINSTKYYNLRWFILIG